LPAHIRNKKKYSVLFVDCDPVNEIELLSERWAGRQKYNTQNLHIKLKNIGMKIFIAVIFTSS
jgi:hypothetical protein